MVIVESGQEEITGLDSIVKDRVTLYFILFCFYYFIHNFVILKIYNRIHVSKSDSSDDLRFSI